MISFLDGKIVEKNPTALVIETGGVGFQLSISLQCFQQLGGVGEAIRILTHLHVREDVLQLYGFFTPAERDLFRLLISISGVGPKLAQGILSGLSVEEFVQAVHMQDIKRLKSAPGVGQKTAERLALELKDKVGKIASVDVSHDAAPISSKQEEALLALLSLGYKESQARDALRTVQSEQPGIESVEELIRLALPYLR